MSFDAFSDIINVLARAHFGFWLSDPKKTSHSVPAKLLAVVLFLTIAIMTIVGRGMELIASAIYAVFFLASLCLAVFIVFIRTRRVRPGDVSTVIEAYVVALFIALLLLFHNVVFPIPYFSVDAGVARDTKSEILISFVYSMPAAVFLAIRTHQFVQRRANLATARLGQANHISRLNGVVAKLKRELFCWYVFHYGVISMLIWIAVFAKEGRLKLLNEALKKLV